MYLKYLYNISNIKYIMLTISISKNTAIICAVVTMMNMLSELRLFMKEK